MTNMKVLVTQLCPTLCDPMVCPWNSPGKNTGMDFCSLLQGIFLTQTPWVGKILRRKRLPTSVSWPGEFHGLYSPQSYKELDMSEKNIYFCFIEYTKAFQCVDHNKLWKILQEMGIPDHLTCLLRNLYAGQVTIKTGYVTTDSFQIGKVAHQGCILSPCLFNLYAEYIM